MDKYSNNAKFLWYLILTLLTLLVAVLFIVQVAQASSLVCEKYDWSSHTWKPAYCWSTEFGSEAEATLTETPTPVIVYETPTATPTETVEPYPEPMNAPIPWRRWISEMR